MKKDIECSVVLLPDNKATGIISYKYIGDKELQFGVYKDLNSYYNPQHLYMLSDEEIKEGDWFIWNNDNSVQKAVSDLQDYTTVHGVNSFDISMSAIGNEAKKIVSSTDKSLGLAPPTNEFLQAWVKNPVEKVLVEFQKESYSERFNNVDDTGINSDNWGHRYNINISPNNTITCKFIEYDWDSIINSFKKIGYSPNLWIEVLKEHYNAPTKKQ